MGRRYQEDEVEIQLEAADSTYKAGDTVKAGSRPCTHRRLRAVTHGCFKPPHESHHCPIAYEHTMRVQFRLDKDF